MCLQLNTIVARKFCVIAMLASRSRWRSLQGPYFRQVEAALFCNTLADLTCSPRRYYSDVLIMRVLGCESGNTTCSHHLILYRWTVDAGGSSDDRVAVETPLFVGGVFLRVEVDKVDGWSFLVATAWTPLKLMIWSSKI